MESSGPSTGATHEAQIDTGARPRRLNTMVNTWCPTSSGTICLRAEKRSNELRVVACPEDVSGACIRRFSRLTSDVEEPMLRTDLRGRFASILREAGSEDCFSTLRRNVPRARSQIVARIHLLNPHCSGSQLSPRSTSAAITSLILAPASPSSRLSLRSTRSAGCRP